MLENNIFIPKKIKVGFQKRDDTYTKKLAYVIYFDQKNKLRKEKSWNNWRDKNIEPIDFNNVAMSGFVLNKKVGGHSSGWNHRQTYVRVYDPRDFELEITIPNLLYILENTNSIKGKRLDGEFVYGWDGRELILVPTSSPDYKKIEEYNNIVYINQQVKTKDLVIGATYLNKKNEQCVYMGKFDLYDFKFCLESYKYKQTKCGKVFFFFVKDNDQKDSDSQDDSFIYYKTINNLFISIIDNNCIDNYSELFERFEHYKYYCPIDDSKDVITEYTFDEFKDELNKLFKEKNWSSKEFYNSNKEKFRVYYDNGQYGLAYNKVNMSLNEVFTILKPVHLDKHLENGKLYRREY